jgi:hypothetical protein
VPNLTLSNLQTTFVLVIVPCVQKYGKKVFRYLKYQDREDALSDMIGFAWIWSLKLLEQGKDPTALSVALAYYAARRVKARRHLTGKEKTRDVMSPSARQAHGFEVQSIPEDALCVEDNPIHEALRDSGSWMRRRV